MNQRQKQLLSILEQQGDWMKGKALATLLSVSDRTIRSDIEKINREVEGSILSHPHKGYLLSVENRQIAETKILPQTADERLNFLLKYLLTSKGAHPLLDLADRLYVSYPTIKLDLQRATQIVATYPDLQLRYKEGTIELLGTEFHKRRFYRDLLATEIKDDFINLDKVMDMYADLDFEWVWTCFQDTLKRYDYPVRSASLPMLVLHIGIALRRAIDAQFIGELPEDVVVTEQERSLAQDFIDQIARHFHLMIPDTEVYSFARLLNTYRDIQQLRIKTDFKGKTIDFDQVVQEIGRRLEELSGLDFLADQDFLMRLHLHLQGLVERLRFDLELPNAFFHDLKRQYPLVFDIAVNISTYLGNILETDLNEEEIGLIAVHIGASYSHLMESRKIPVYLLAPKNYSLVTSSLERLEQRFAHRIQIVEQSDYFSVDRLQQKEVELVITFSPIPQSLSIPVVCLSTFFNAEDELTLIAALNKIEKQQTDVQLALQIRKFLTERFFYSNLDMKDADSVLQFMADNLYQEGIVSDEFLSSVRQREALSPTDFDYAIAIPHPLQAYSKQSVISIAVLSEAITWGKYPVKMVIMLALKDTDSQFIQLFFHWLGNCLGRPEKMENLLSAQTGEAFISAILDE